MNHKVLLVIHILNQHCAKIPDIFVHFVSAVIDSCPGKIGNIAFPHELSTEV